MLNEQALLKEIVAAPGRNVPRRQYAELLVAAGDVYGEFIQTQLEIDRLQRLPKYDSALSKLLEQEKKLLTPENKQKWAGPVSAIATDWMFSRGFVAGVRLSPELFAEKAELLCQAAPLTYLRLTAATVENLGKLAQSPFLSQIVALSLYENKLSDAGLTALLNSPYLQGLRWLDLSWNLLTEAALDLLGATPNLPALAWIGLARNKLEDPVDEPAVDQGAVLFYDLPASGVKLEACYGVKKWLHWRAHDGGYFSPSSFALVRISE